MSSGSPLDRVPSPKDVFDAVEGPVGDALERVVQTGVFGQVVRTGVSLQATARRQAERLSRRLWHAINLPTGTDVRRLEAQISRLERSVEQARDGDDTTRREPPVDLP